MTSELSHIPTTLAAGDAATWRLVFFDYPASDGWAVSYVLVATGQQITINATADGDDHLVDLTSTTTAAYIPGVYDYRQYVTKDGNRYTLAAGKIEITPNFADATDGLDARTPAERTLDLLQTTYDTLAARVLASKSGGSIATTDKELTELREQINKQKIVVITERRKQRIKEGKRPGTKIKARFT